MRTYCTVIFFLAIFLALFSCKNQEDITKRKYTDGQYRDFNLHREKSGKEKPLDSVAVEPGHPVLLKMKEELLPPVAELKAAVQNPDPTNAFYAQYPLIADQLDSVLVKQTLKDSAWNTDSVPDVIMTALAGQAMVGLGTVGGLATIAAPELIWFTIIPMIGIPFFLLISLIAAAIAMAKINSGEIDKSYRRWMRLWAVCLLINLCLGSIVLLHFTSL
jgi:hypothetical protein